MTDIAGSKTRRSLLGVGARLALLGPAVVAGLHIAGGTALADDDNPDDQGRGQPGDQAPRPNFQPVRRGTFSADLVPTSAVNQSDFNPNISDSGFGTLSVGSAGTSSSTVVVTLRGATANQTYTLAFVPLNNNGARQSLGSFTTNASGNARVSLDGALAESGSASDRSTRVGVFVLRRGDINGVDAFVTAA